MAVAVRPGARAHDEPVVEPSAVLVLACDGYRRGTTGTVVGRRQGCLVFEPDRPERVARWANPRRSLLVPPSFVAEID